MKHAILYPLNKINCVNSNKPDIDQRAPTWIFVEEKLEREWRLSGNMKGNGVYNMQVFYVMAGLNK